MRKMKDSGIEWIGEIPEDWKLKRLQDVADYKKGPFGSAITKNMFVEKNENTIKVYEQKNVINKDATVGYYYISYEKYLTLKKFEVNPGDILVTCAGTIGEIFMLPSTCEKGIINQALMRIRLYNNILPKYYLYIFTTVIEVTSEKYSNGSAMKNIPPFAIMKKLQFPYVPIEIQKKISNFLDGKCGQIDSVKINIQKQIETLEQYKKSVITETVTKGLNPNVKMKDSGIEWIGEIPEHWETKRGKYIFTQRNDRGNNIELQLLSPTQKYGVIPQTLYDEISGMNSVKLKENTDFNLLKTCHKGDFCISLRSFQGGFEYSKYEGVVSPAYQIFYSITKIADGYYKYLFKEKNFIEKINSFTMSLRDGKPISFFDFANMYLPLPSAEEQQQIADYLDKKCLSVDSIITSKKQQLEKLEEYKKSLIFEYVTGKKEV